LRFILFDSADSCRFLCACRVVLDIAIVFVSVGDAAGGTIVVVVAFLVERERIDAARTESLSPIASLFQPHHPAGIARLLRAGNFYFPPDVQPVHFLGFFPSYLVLPHHELVRRYSLSLQPQVQEQQLAD